MLLVDEAYYLYNAANDRDYGQESIEILLTFMENNRPGRREVPRRAPGGLRLVQ